MTETMIDPLLFGTGSVSCRKYVPCGSAWSSKSYIPRQFNVSLEIGKPTNLKSKNAVEVYL